jgi:hypothetical protein
MAHRRAELDEGHERHRRRPTPAPFIGHWTLAFLALPWVGTLFFLINDGVTSVFGTQRITFYGDKYWDIRIGFFDHKLGDLIIGLTMLLSCGLVAIVLGIGFKVTRRIPFVVWHVAASCMIAGLLVWGTTTLGWTPTWLVMHGFGSAFLAFSWNLYRIDALRSAAQGERSHGDDDRDNKWAQLIGLASSEPLLGTAEITPDAITVDIEHKGGEVLDNVQNATTKIATAAGAVSARAIAGPTANRSTLTIVRRDFLTGKWREWPGLSHPGGSFADPTRTAYYDDGLDQNFWFVPIIGGGLSVARASVRRGRTSIGRQGTTGAGKSGDSNNEQAEVLSRRDALGVIVDVDKFMQNAGWCGDMLLMAANDNAKANAVQRAVKRLAKVRQARMARYGFREWGPEAYEHPQCRTAALYFFFDEADSVLGQMATWISAKGLAAGIFGSYTIPSADHESMPPRLRRSVGAWKCFGCGDPYSASFVLDKVTLKAAATNPGDWGSQFPGAHLLDSAPGVDKRRYPITARTYLSEHKDLRAEVLEAREHFDPVFVHPEDEDALGDALVSAHPNNLPVSADEDDALTAEDLAQVREAMRTEQPRETVRILKPQATRPAPPMRAAPAPDDDDEEDDALTREARGPRAELDPETDRDDLTGDEADEFEQQDKSEREAEEGDMQALEEKALNRPRRHTNAFAALSEEDQRAINNIDPQRLVPPGMCGPSVTLDDDVPAAESEEDGMTEFDRVLVELAQEGRSVIHNRDIIERCRKWSAPAVSKRMTALCNGDAVTPPGVSITRVMKTDRPNEPVRGTFAIVWEGVPQLTASGHTG